MIDERTLSADVYAAIAKAYDRECDIEDAVDAVLEIIEADRNRRGEPVAWRYLTPTGWHATTDAARALGVAEHHTVEPLFAAPQPDEPSKGETVLYTSQNALDLTSRSDAVISVGLTRVPQMSWNVPLYTAPQPAEPVTPRTHFEDARVQKVYEIICGDNHPPFGEHWDGYVSRLIVDALFPAEPVKSHLTVKYNDQGDYLYICCDSNEPAEAEENEQGILLWRAYSDGRLVGVTIPNFIGPMSNR